MQATGLNISGNKLILTFLHLVDISVIDMTSHFPFQEISGIYFYLFPPKDPLRTLKTLFEGSGQEGSGQGSASWTLVIS